LSDGLLIVILDIRILPKVLGLVNNVLAAKIRRLRHRVNSIRLVLQKMLVFPRHPVGAPDGVERSGGRVVVRSYLLLLRDERVV
jgi:hypothetical protein